MKYLIIDNEDGEVFQSDREPDSSTNEAIDKGIISLVRFHEGQFEIAAIVAVDIERSLTWGPMEERA